MSEEKVLVEEKIPPTPEVKMEVAEKKKPNKKKTTIIAVAAIIIVALCFGAFNLIERMQPLSVSKGLNSVDAYINIGNDKDKDVMVVLLKPDENGNEVKDTNWTENPEILADLQQVTLNSKGKAKVPLNFIPEVKGKYTLVVQASSGTNTKCISISNGYCERYKKSQSKEQGGN